MKNILGNAIKDLRKSKKLTQKQLSELTGYKQNTISNHENGNRQLDENDIRVYAKALDVSPQTLFDKTNPRVTTSLTPPNSPVATISDKVVYLDQELKEPRHSRWISHGEQLLKEQATENTVEESQAVYYTYNYYDQPASAGTGQYLNDVQVEQIELPINVKADFVVPIYGDSMEPEYQSGDYIFVKLSVDLSDGDIGVFEYYGDAYIKQLLINEDGAFLHSLNEKYKDIRIDRDSDFRIIGQVVDVYRG
ncbi:TPA: helix-turn-helix transcriptional regulator [Streptococcus suis]|nr:helix-turn-helix transcriptional regulator [Streptococcus suis]